MPTELPKWWVPASIDLERPNAARVYDYLLGGGCNFEPDRLFADQLLATNPEAEDMIRLNRAFLGRAVRFCMKQGIRQFLDFGSGLPTAGNVHEIAERAAPGCRVVYVDNEPITVEHSQLMLDDNDHAAVVLADVVDVDAVLRSQPVHRLIDFTQPVAVIMAAVLHFVPDSADPYGVVARYVQAMTSGSFLVVSHGAGADQQLLQYGRQLYGHSSTPRTRDDVRTLLAGTQLVEPGVVWTPQWRPEFDPGNHPERARIYVAVGCKP
jgi:hypothetical protein